MNWINRKVCLYYMCGEPVKSVSFTFVLCRVPSLHLPPCLPSSFLVPPHRPHTWYRWEIRTDDLSLSAVELSWEISPRPLHSPGRAGVLCSQAGGLTAAGCCQAPQ